MFYNETLIAEARAVAVEVTLPSQYIKITRQFGWGDNPVFYAWQVEQALDGLKESLRGMIVAEYGPQSEVAPLNAGNIPLALRGEATK